MAQNTHRSCPLQVVGSVTGLRVLDLGCGNGYLARKLAKQSAKVTGVDSSVRLIELARARENKNPLGITYHATDAANLEMLEDESFDITISNMAMMNIARADVAIRGASRVLRPEGRLVMSLSHSCFETGNSAWLIERVSLKTTVYRKVSRYREPHEEFVPWNYSPGQ
jgi:ubiquinone/menaquinone biosynthesis C-methylase UbiE